MGRTSDARDRLIDTAIDLIRGQSYESVSVDRLCRHAGVKKGSFYHFFPSKQALLLQALERYWDNTRRKILVPAFERDIAPLARIARAFEMAAANQRELKRKSGHVPGCAMGNLALELSTQCDEIRLKLDSFFRQFAEFFQRALEEAQAAGDIPGVEPKAMSQSLLAYLYGCILLAKTSNDDTVLYNLPKHALSLIGNRAA